MVWVAQSRNTWDSSVFKLSLLLRWLSTSSARNGSLALLLKFRHVGWCSEKLLVGSSHSCIMSKDDMWRMGEILWMLFYDRALQEICQCEVFMVSLLDVVIRIFLLTLSRTPHRVLESGPWESHVKEIILSFVCLFCALSVLWLLALFWNSTFLLCQVTCSFPFCVFSTCLIVSTCCCLSPPTVYLPTFSCLFEPASTPCQACLSSQVFGLHWCVVVFFFFFSWIFNSACSPCSPLGHF